MMGSLMLAIESIGELCASLRPALRLVGYLVLGIKVAVPIMLIISGMMDMARASMEAKPEKIKDAQGQLVKKAIAAALVFLVTTTVGALMNLIGNTQYKECMQCINDPSSCTVAE